MKMNKTIINKNLKKLFIVAFFNLFNVNLQAISFRDLPDNEKRIYIDTLYLRSKNLTDLEGFDEIPRINQLKYLDLSNNELQSLPERFLENAPILNRLVLKNNPIPGTTAQLIEKHPSLTRISNLLFKIAGQEDIEQELYNLITNPITNTTITEVRHVLRSLGALRVLIDKVRYEGGKTLLHLAVNQPEIFKIILDWAKRFQPSRFEKLLNAKDNHGTSALQYAIGKGIFGEEEFAQILT